MSYEGRRKQCVNGCGRTTQRPDGVCMKCVDGHGPTEPDPRRLSNEYLLRCVAELTRRRDELDAAIRKARAA